MDRLRISGAVPADVAEVLSDKADALFAPDLKRAREELAEKLREGKKVAGLSMRDLIDCELNSERYQPFLSQITSLLLKANPDYSRDEVANSIMDSLIARHLDAHPEAVEEEAAENVEAA